MGFLISLEIIFLNSFEVQLEYLRFLETTFLTIFDLIKDNFSLEKLDGRPDLGWFSKLFVFLYLLIQKLTFG